MNLATKLKLDKKLVQSANITDLFTSADLDSIGEMVAQGYEEDEASRVSWRRRNAAGMDLAMQVVKEKSFPWPNASNVAFPLVTIATLQFHSRAYPAIVQGTEVVRYRVVGQDLDGSAKDRAERIGCHMSYQVMEEDQAWEEQHDRLLINVPIVGCAFKKTYYDGGEGHNKSELVLAVDLVMNYYAKSVETCQRKTHVVMRYRNQIYEGVKAGRYRDILKESWYEHPAPLEDEPRRDGTSPPATPDHTTPFIFLEQHCWCDFDKDGYAEPYVITVEKASRQVIRIVTRFDRMEDIQKNKDGEVLKIDATEYFTKYPFIPSPDGSVYDMGFGLLLGPLNESVNTLVNQLIDAGTWSTTAGGFLGKGAKIRGGVYTFAPLEWKRVDSTGDDLRKNIVPHDVREPSNVLFQLLGLLIQYTDRISGSTEANVGENVGQNTKAATFEGMVEQGSKVYAAIFKRIWRSMKEEFKKLYLINATHLPDRVSYGEGLETGREDYRGDANRIVPVADPNVLSDHTRVIQALTIADRAHQVPGYNAELAEGNLLKALRIENVTALYPGVQATGGPPKDVKLQIAELKAQGEAAALQQAQQQFIIEMMETQRMNAANIILLEAQAQKAASDAASEQGWQQIETLNATINMAKHQDEVLRSRIELVLDGMRVKNEARKLELDAKKAKP